MVFAKLSLAASVITAGVDASALRQTVFLNERMSEAELRQTLLDEIEGSYGSVNQRGRLISIEAGLSSMYKALPKNEHGKLSHNTVRYALHRIFVQRHGWYIKGLEPHAPQVNLTSPTGVLKEQVPAYVEELFEQRLGKQGFSLHDTAVLAATIEHLIHSEAEGRLMKAYSVKELSMSSELNNSQMEAVLDSYMKHYILSDSIAAKIDDKQMNEVFPGWPETQVFVRDVLREFSTGFEKKFSYNKVLEVVEEIGERYGRFQDSECRMMKTKLMDLGDHGVGRIPLQNFYKTSLDDSSFEFQESPAYLKMLGAMDDQDHVIIPNYLGSTSNCIASSNLYSVCCINECESLMGHLESQVGGPEATPQQIAALVANLPSSTIDAPRQLSDSLMQRLTQISEQHDGTVQLHGRLFAQWLHHAYPRECPFPHVTGSISPVTPDEWMEEHGNTGFYATKDEMMEHSQRSSDLERTDDLVHWIDDEELLVPRVQRRKNSGMSFLACMAFGFAVVSMVVKSASSAKSVKSAMDVLHGRESSKKGMILPTFSQKSHLV
jgi:hypothetical protein